MTPSISRDWLEDAARRHCLDALGVAPADDDPALKARLAEFLAAGHHGDMLWLEGRTEFALFRDRCPPLGSPGVAGRYCCVRVISS